MLLLKLKREAERQRSKERMNADSKQAHLQIDGDTADSTVKLWAIPMNSPTYSPEHIEGKASCNWVKFHQACCTRVAAALAVLPCQVSVPFFSVSVLFSPLP